MAAFRSQGYRPYVPNGSPLQSNGQKRKSPKLESFLFFFSDPKRWKNTEPQNFGLSQAFSRASSFIKIFTQLMMLCCSSLRSRIRSWFLDYDKLQSFAVILIYVQIGCALVGSLGALFNGVSLINFGIALFALVAIESGSQRLGRTYGVLLCCGILLDISWFILFFNHVWNIASNEKYGPHFIFSLRLALWMQIVAFSVRLVSSLLWIQMYRMGVSSTDFDLRNSFFNPSTSAIGRQSSISSCISGFPLSDPTYYSSLFEEAQENGGG